MSESKQAADWIRRKKRIEVGKESLYNVDPTGKMTLENLAELSPKMQVAYDHGIRTLTEDEEGREPIQGLMLLGSPGCGKTHMATGLARKALADGIPATGLDVLGFVIDVQKSYGDPEAKSRTKVIEKICEYEVVVLDDLGKERVSEDVDTLLYELISLLEKKGRKLIVTSNLSVEQYKERYDWGLRSRLDGMCRQLELDETDRRRQGGGRYRA